HFVARMSAKDGSQGFDFGGTYTKIVPQALIAYVMSAGRTVQIEFSESNGQTNVTETFDPETENTIELQRAGWQAILNNFKTYVEGV
ncbi:SRPBCC domain-containing protein, partial [Staphylococcus aureus]|uniref:SRPBCC domain-containing protein n=1 Tax=Staphylococcus aureus TaxID=1280 RepID=UPI001E3EB6A9